MMRMSRLTKEFTPSQHDLNPAFADKFLPGSRRPATRGRSPWFWLHIGDRVLVGWCTPYVDPALPPRQSRPHCQRPQSSLQTTTIVVGMDQVEPNIRPNTVLQLVLLLHPELPVAIVEGEWRLQYCSLTFNIMNINGSF